MVVETLNYRMSRFGGCPDRYLIPLPNDDVKIIDVYPNRVLDKADYELLKKHGHLKDREPKLVM